MQAVLPARAALPAAGAVPDRREKRLHRIMLSVVFYWACAIYIDAYLHAHEGFRIESFFSTGASLLAVLVLILGLVPASATARAAGGELTAAFRGEWLTIR